MDKCYSLGFVLVLGHIVLVWLGCRSHLVDRQAFVIFSVAIDDKAYFAIIKAVITENGDCAFMW
ncbi:hypothetical protein C8B47_03645 [filamentous cyanobacterium CCP4]|nr:hypothetical protein C8B47_03645 [filamentous cyanobacterium CCP4]